MTLCLLAAGQPAAGQSVPRFRVTDLTDLYDPNIIADDEGTMGINNKGQVAYTRYLSGNYRAWVWLPVAEYGFAADTVHTIGASSSDSIARDINENGKIAGVSGPSFSHTDRKATVWTLASGAASSQTLNTDNPSEVYALDNDSSPHVVGFRTIEDDEPCPPAEFYDEAFQWVPGGSVLALGAIGNQTLSEAFDIRRNGSEVAVGESSPCRPWNACLPGQVGTAWTSGSGAAVDVGDVRQSAAGNDRESHPYGINDDQNVVGWVLFKPTGTINCFPTATYWDSPSDTDPVDLAQFLAVPYHHSRAFAINSLVDPQVVGRNEETNRAILWEYSSGWSSTDLNRSDSPPNYVIADCADAQWEITEAHDINDDGWIVALGTTVVSSTTQLHALLLTPVGTCPFDIDGDGDIDEDDSVAIYTFMIHNPVVTGACGPGIICIWDVNFDCVVNGDDMDAVLDHIANCQSEPCLCEGGESFGGGGLSAERFAIALAACNPALTEEQIGRSVGTLLRGDELIQVFACCVCAMRMRGPCL